MDELELPGAAAPEPGERPAPAANVTPTYDDDPDYDPRGLTKMTEVCDRAKARWEYAQTCDSENRLNQVSDLKFAWVRGEQWNAGIRRQREAATPPRPWLEFNQTGQFVKQIVNDQRQNKAAIKVRPAGGGATKKLADLRAGIIRGIEYYSKADAIYDSTLEQGVTGGRGYFRVVTEWEREDSFDQVLRLRGIPDAQNAVLDPDACEPDKSDARWGFVCDFVSKDTYEKEWPEARNVVSWDSMDWACYLSADGRVCVADYFEVVEYDDTLVALSNGEVMWRAQYDDMAKKITAALPVNVMSDQLGGLIIPQIIKSESRKRTRVDYYKLSALPHPLAKYEWRGKYVPIVCVPGDEIVIEGKRIYQGIIRRLRDAQMMYNYWFTLATERIALAPKSPFIALKGQTEEHAEWATANTDNHAVLPYDPVKIGETWHITPPGRTEAIQIDAGLVTMLQLCAANLREITGMKGAALGDNPKANQPYASLLDQQRRGDNATYHYGDNLARGIGLAGRIIDDLIPHIYDSQRQLATVEPDGKTQKTVMINQRQPNPNAPDDPAQAQVLNCMTQGSFDIVIETGPSYATRRVEAATEMREFMDAMGPQTASLIGDVFADMADWPGDVGTKIAARLRAMLPPQIQALEANPDADPHIAQMQAALTGLQQQMQAQQQQFTQAFAKSQADNAELTHKLQMATIDKAMTELKAANAERDSSVKMADVLTKQKDAVMRAEGQRRSDDIELIIKRMDAVVKILTLVAKASPQLGADPAQLGALTGELQSTIETPVEPDIAGGPHVRTGEQGGAAGGSTSTHDANMLAQAVLAIHDRLNVMHDDIQQTKALALKPRKRMLKIHTDADGMPTGGESVDVPEPMLPTPPTVQ